MSRSLSAPYRRPRGPNFFAGTHLPSSSTEVRGSLRSIIMVDLDAFYAQVESVRLGLDHSIPLAVQQWDGIIANNYASRKYGVKRMDTAGEARRKCPTIRLVHVETVGGNVDNEQNRERIVGDSTEEEIKKTADRNGGIREREKVSLRRYREASAKVFDAIFDLMKSYGVGGRVERASVDEAFLDVTSVVEKKLRKSTTTDLEEILRSSGTILAGGKIDLEAESDRRLVVASAIAKEMRDSIFVKCRYTCSAGISINKTVAKLASSLNKPNRQTLVCQGAVQEVLGKIPLRKIRGFGGKLGQAIETLGVKTAEDAQNLSEDLLAETIGRSSAQWVYRIVRGMDDSEVVERERVKSLLAAKSFSPVDSFSSLDKWLAILAAELDERMRFEETHHRRDAKTLSLTFRCRNRSNGAFVSSTRSRLMPKVTAESRSRVLKETALDILKANVGLSSTVSAFYFPVTFLGLAATNFNDRAQEESAITRYFQSKAVISSSASGSDPVEGLAPKYENINRKESPLSLAFKESNQDESSKDDERRANVVVDVDEEQNRRRREYKDLQLALRIQRQEDNAVKLRTSDKVSNRPRKKLRRNSQSIERFFKPKNTVKLK